MTVYRIAFRGLSTFNKWEISRCIYPTRREAAEGVVHMFAMNEADREVGAYDPEFEVQIREYDEVVYCDTRNGEYYDEKEMGIDYRYDCVHCHTEAKTLDDYIAERITNGTLKVCA